MFNLWELWLMKKTGACNDFFPNTNSFQLQAIRWTFWVKASSDSFFAVFSAESYSMKFRVFSLHRNTDKSKKPKVADVFQNVFTKSAGFYSELSDVFRYIFCDTLLPANTIALLSFFFVIFNEFTIGLIIIRIVLKTRKYINCIPKVEWRQKYS